MAILNNQRVFCFIFSCVGNATEKNRRGKEKLERVTWWEVSPIRLQL